MNFINMVKSIQDYDIKNVYYSEPIKNNIMINSNFIRILYSTHNIVFNGIYLLIQLYDIRCDKYYNKYSCSFNPDIHKQLIEKLRKIEYDLLNIIKISNKKAYYKINEQLNNGYIKLFEYISNKAVNNFILKISGIWENTTNYGLTYKFINI